MQKPSNTGILWQGEMTTQKEAIFSLIGHALSFHGVSHFIGWASHWQQLKQVIMYICHVVHFITQMKLGE